ncbi:MAG: PA0069 family radical SAM protein [Rhodospirillales bacterium]|nr:PA0069 family radical SAM protein [Rhodospirillales bacterium]MBO6785233.1 PA0069 family radical SAM protein [Rhodospirillales bacterium]
MVDIIPDQARKGRGAVSNRTGRFEPLAGMRIDDGWGTGDDLAAEKLRTTVTDEHPKTIIATNSSPDIPFERSINPYRGCEHGCVYCYARPTHAYHGLSPGLDFETRLFAKPDAARLLEDAFRKPSYKPQTIQLGANTDPYQPIERARRITRSVIEVMHRYDHPLGITTKSDLVLRDLDLLAPMAAKGLAAVAVSVTTLDARLARTMEPRCPRPEKRLNAIRELSAAGVPVAVMTAPLVPGLNDHEIEDILAGAADAGAMAAEYIMLRLPLEIHELFEEWLAAHVPDRAKKVMSLVRDTRGGKVYDSAWSERMKGKGVYADMIAARFRAARRKYGFAHNAASGFKLRSDLFTRPLGSADQPSLFD